MNSSVKGGEIAKRFTIARCGTRVKITQSSNGLVASRQDQGAQVCAAWEKNAVGSTVRSASSTVFHNLYRTHDFQFG